MSSGCSARLRPRAADVLRQARSEEGVIQVLSHEGSAGFGGEQDVSLPASCRVGEPWQAPADPAGTRSPSCWRPKGSHGRTSRGLASTAASRRGCFRRDGRGKGDLNTAAWGMQSAGLGGWGCRAGPWGRAPRLGSCKDASLHQKCIRKELSLAGSRSPDR